MAVAVMASDPMDWLLFTVKVVADRMAVMMVPAVMPLPRTLCPTDSGTPVTVPGTVSVVPEIEPVKVDSVGGERLRAVWMMLAAFENDVAPDRLTEPV